MEEPRYSTPFRGARASRVQGPCRLHNQCTPGPQTDERDYVANEVQFQMLGSGHLCAILMKALFQFVVV